MKRILKNVKTYTQSNMLGLVFENSNENSYLSSEKSFDKNGNLLIEKDFSVDGSMEINNIYEYDEQNRLIKAVYLDENEDVMETHLYEYDAQNLLIKEIFCYGDENPDDEDACYDIIEFEYDKDNNRIKKTSVDSDGNFNGEKLNVYQEGRLIREVNFGEEKNMEIEVLYEYDNQGNILSEKRIDHTENVQNVLKYEYNDRDLKTKSLVYNNYEQLIRISTMEYDEDDNLIGLTEENRDSYVVKSFEYDSEKSKIIAENLYNKEGELKEFRHYEFDGDLPLKMDHFVYSPESSEADEDGFLLNGSVKYDYTFFE